MFRNYRLHRLLPALVLAALVVGLGSPAHARPAVREGAAADFAWSPLSSLWSSVARLFTGTPSTGAVARGRNLSHLSGAEGASLDPDGKGTTGTGTGTSTSPGQGSGSL